MNSKLLSCSRAVVSLVIACTLGMLSLSNASAISQSQLQNINEQVITVDGKKYAVSVEDKADKRVSIVKDESGKSVSAVFDKKTGKIRVNDQEINVDNSVGSLIDFDHSDTVLLAASSSKSKNKVIKRKTYTIPEYMADATAILAFVIGAVSVYPIATLIVGSIIGNNLWGKPIKITITEYRTAKRYKSGQHKGRYKYWTNVLVKSGKLTLLNQNHSVVYTK